MSFFDHQTPVRYACTCGELKSIARIYFCRHCSALRCGFCVSHEVDARYCPVCLENLPVAEAWMKNNCCSSCINCPICGLNLTTRVTTVKNKEVCETSEKEDGKPEKTETKKFYYLCCFGCHWTSRDVGIPDQTTASAAWPEFENSHSARLNELMEYYKAVSLNDKILSEKKHPPSRRTYSHLTGMTASMVRRKVGFPSYPGGPFSIPGLQEVRKPPEIKPSIPTSDVNDLPEGIFTETPDLIKVTTLEQRLSMPGLQCKNTSELKPCKKLLLTKRSQRCRECEHNVTKPEFNPSSIKFKILLSAYYHIPNISVKKCEPLHPGKSSDLIIHMINPTAYQMIVKFLPFETEIKRESTMEEAPPATESGEAGDGSKQNKMKRVPLKIDYLMKVEPRPVGVNFTGSPDLPESSIIIPRRDDAAEYDDTIENQNFNDDRKVVVWRKGNQAEIKFPIKPNQDLELGAAVVIGFMLSHTYVNTIIQDKGKQEINHHMIGQHCEVPRPVLGGRNNVVLRLEGLAKQDEIPPPSPANTWVKYCQWTRHPLSTVHVQSGAMQANKMFAKTPRPYRKSG